MYLLPSEQQHRIIKAIKEFRKDGSLNIYEPCNCGSRPMHNNGGNYHNEIYLQDDNGEIFVKYETTCELVAPAEWEVCENWQQVVRDNADWL